MVRKVGHVNPQEKVRKRTETYSVLNEDYHDRLQDSNAFFAAPSVTPPSPTALHVERTRSPPAARSVLTLVELIDLVRRQSPAVNPHIVN